MSSPMATILSLRRWLSTGELTLQRSDLKDHAKLDAIAVMVRAALDEINDAEMAYPVPVQSTMSDRARIGFAEKVLQQAHENGTLAEGEDMTTPEGSPILDEMHELTSALVDYHKAHGNVVSVEQLKSAARLQFLAGEVNRILDEMLDRQKRLNDEGVKWPKEKE